MRHGAKSFMVVNNGFDSISDYKKKITMVQIINGRIYYLGTYGNKFIDITDDYSRFIITKN